MYLDEFSVANKKSLQSRWLKTMRELSKITDVFPLFLEGKGQKSRCTHAHTPSRDSGGQSVAALHLLEGSGSPWACGCLPPVSASIFTRPLSSLSCPSVPLPSKDTSPWTEPSITPYHFTLHIGMHSTYFQMYAHTSTSPVMN